MKRVGYSLFILIVCLSLAAPVWAQQQPGLSLVPEQVDLTAYPKVALQLSAWRADGSPLADLAPQDFTLQEDDGPTFHPDTVSTDSKAALSVVLVVDISGSMAGQPLTDAKVAAARFLDHLAPGDQAALIAFSDGVDPDPTKLNPARELGFTASFKPLYDAIEALKAGGNTHLYNALAKAVQWAANLPAGHRAVLLLSDGKNEPPALGNPETPIQLAKAAGLPVLVIGLGSQVDEPYLRRLASETGGVFRAAPTSAELAGQFTDSAALLKTRYTLGYTPKLAGDGKAHTLHVNLSSSGASAAAQIAYGPLAQAPAATPTLLPSPTLAPLPTATALPPTATLFPTPTPLALPAPDSGSTTLFIGLGVLLVGAIALVAFLSRRKPQAAGEKCARCGADCTGKAGPCPVCGETRRLSRK